MCVEVEYFKTYRRKHREITTRRVAENAAESLLRNRRGVGTCVRAYVLDTRRAPVYGCVHMPKNVRDRVQR